jgi:hypothetical protein
LPATRRLHLGIEDGQLALAANEVAHSRSLPALRTWTAMASRQPKARIPQNTPVNQGIRGREGWAFKPWGHES